MALVLVYPFKNKLIKFSLNKTISSDVTGGLERCVPPMKSHLCQSQLFLVGHLVVYYLRFPFWDRRHLQVVHGIMTGTSGSELLKVCSYTLVLRGLCYIFIYLKFVLACITSWIPNSWLIHEPRYEGCVFLIVSGGWNAAWCSASCISYAWVVM